MKVKNNGFMDTKLLFVCILVIYPCDHVIGSCGSPSRPNSMREFRKKDKIQNSKYSF